MIQQFINFSLAILCLASCANSSEKNNEPEPILSANREAPIGWINFNAYSDNTFEYILSSRQKYTGTFKTNADTLFLTCNDTTIGIDRVIIKEKSLEFFGDESPGDFATISVNKMHE